MSYYKPVQISAPSIVPVFHPITQCSIHWPSVLSIVTVFHPLAQCSIHWPSVPSIDPVFYPLSQCSIHWPSILSVDPVFHLLSQFLSIDKVFHPLTQFSLYWPSFPSGPVFPPLAQCSSVRSIVLSIRPLIGYFPLSIGHSLHQSMNPIFHCLITVFMTHWSINPSFNPLTDWSICMSVWLSMSV
jgi:hypothetical protein